MSVIKFPDGEPVSTIKSTNNNTSLGTETAQSKQNDKLREENQKLKEQLKKVVFKGC